MTDLVPPNAKREPYRPKDNPLPLGEGNRKTTWEEGDRLAEKLPANLIHPSFPSQGTARPSHEGSQSASPQGDYEEAAPYLTNKQGWPNE